MAGTQPRTEGLPTRSGLKHRFRIGTIGLGALLLALAPSAGLVLIPLGLALVDRGYRPAGRRPLALLAGLVAIGSGLLAVRHGIVAAGIVALGAAAILIALRPTRARARLAEQIAIAVALLGVATLLGHIYHARWLLSVRYGAIPLDTTIGILAGALGVLLLVPSAPAMSLMCSTSIAGREARRLVFLYAPLVLLMAALLTAWEFAGWLTAGEAEAFRTLAFLLAMFGFGWRAFRDLDRAEYSLTQALGQGEKIKTALQAELMQRTSALTATSLRAEAARAQLQAVVESAPDLIAAIDPDFHQVVANRAYLTAFRGDYEQPALRAAWARALAGERFTSEDEIPRFDGTPAIWERAYGPVKDGRGHVIGAVGVLRDITARRALEHEAAASRRLLEAVLHHTPAGVFVKQADGRYILANPVFGRMAHRDPATIPGCRDDDLFAPDVAAGARESDRWALEQRAAHEREVTLTLPGGDQRTFLVSKAPMPDGQGGWWLCGVATDMTDQKRADAALKRSELDLAGRNRDLETLLHVISHDLKEPLRSIESFSRLLASRHGTQLDPRGADFLERVVKAAGRMGRLLEEIQLLARARRAEPADAEVDGGEIAQEVLARLDGAIREASATVVVDPALPSLRVERVWATQALYNLVANALKFRRPGAPADIAVTAWRRDGLAGFQVLDRGPGVPAEQSERIFQLFQRGVGREVPGTGAGLAIVRQIAERHGGRAWVEPRPGGGSAFTVVFAAEGERAA